MSIVAAASTAAGPALNGLAALTTALKEPGGKRKMEELRKEFAQSLGDLHEVVDKFEAAISALESEMERQDRNLDHLKAQVDYLSLPWWKRWFTKKPQP